MFGHTGRHHVRNEPRHYRRPKHVIQPLEPSFYKTHVHVVEEIVHILHGQCKIFKTELERQHSLAVESALVNLISANGHRDVSVAQHHERIADRLKSREERIARSTQFALLQTHVLFFVFLSVMVQTVLPGGDWSVAVPRPSP